MSKIADELQDFLQQTDTHMNWDKSINGVLESNESTSFEDASDGWINSYSNKQMAIYGKGNNFTDITADWKQAWAIELGDGKVRVEYIDRSLESEILPGDEDQDNCFKSALESGLWYIGKARYNATLETKPFETDDNTNTQSEADVNDVDGPNEGDVHVGSHPAQEIGGQLKQTTVLQISMLNFV